MSMQNLSVSGGGLRRVWTILRKEFLEIFRDKRTLSSVIIGPLLVTPGLLAVVGWGITRQVEKSQARTYPVGVVGMERGGPLAEALKAAPQLKVTPVATAGEAEARIRKRALRAAVVFPPDAAARLRAREAVPIEILHDAGDEASRGAMGRLQRLLGDVGKDITGARLRERGLPPDFAVPLKVAERPIPGGGGIGLLILGQMLPYILVLAAFTGAISPAFDQVAGEKERGTLETLLVAPASRRDVVLGKFGAVVAVCLISSVLSIVGFAIPFVSGLTVFAWLSQGGVRISPSALAAIGIVILPLSVLFAGLLLAVSTWARNQKEAQTYLSTLFPVVLVPALLSTTIGSEVSRAIALVPILNASIIIKQALSGTYDPVFIALAFAASAVYAALALAFATRLFQRESVLLKM